MTNATGPRRLGIAEVERRLGVDRTTVWRWCKAGMLPKPHYLGTRRAWFEEDIVRFEAGQMARSSKVRHGARNLRAHEPVPPTPSKSENSLARSLSRQPSSRGPSVSATRAP